MEKSYLAALFHVNEAAFLLSQSLEPSEIKGEIKEEFYHDQSGDLSEDNKTHRSENCELGEKLLKPWNPNVILLKVEKREEEYNLVQEPSWINSETVIQVDSDSDVLIHDDNIDVKEERVEEDSVLIGDPCQVKSEREIRVDTEGLITNDYVHTKLENERRDGFCLQMKSELAQNQATSSVSNEIRLEQNEEVDVSFDGACPSSSTDSNRVTTRSMSAKKQKNLKSCTVFQENRHDRITEGGGNNVVSTATIGVGTRNEKDLKAWMLCIFCGMEFTHMDNFKRHLDNHLLLPKETYKCTDCNRSFTDSLNLTKHMLFHSKHRPHKCTFCDKAFTYPKYLRSHLLIHTTTKSHKCTVCDKSFSLLKYLKRHLLIHKTPKYCLQ